MIKPMGKNAIVTPGRTNGVLVAAAAAAENWAAALSEKVPMIKAASVLERVLLSGWPVGVLAVTMTEGVSSIIICVLQTPLVLCHALLRIVCSLVLRVPTAHDLSAVDFGNDENWMCNTFYQMVICGLTLDGFGETPSEGSLSQIRTSITNVDIQAGRIDRRPVARGCRDLVQVDL